jgi:xyloglucan-specific exo-beta-1,4-glucanase
MIESLEIDPFDSNHWLYGTGKSVYGGHDLTNWDTKHNISISVLANGIEETSVQDLIAPPGLPLVSSVGDVAGWVHTSLTTAPQATIPFYGTTSSLDYAGNVPKTQVVIGNSADGSTIQIANTYDGGNTWSQNYAASTSPAGGRVALSASATTIVWSTGNGGVVVSKNSASFSSVTGLSSGAFVASDKRNDTVFYGSNGGSVLVSTNGGTSFGNGIQLGSSTSVSKIVANPTVAGDVWASTDKGLWHSTNYGKTWTGIPGATQGWAFALGKSNANSFGYNIYGFFTVGGVSALYQSTNLGSSWTMISDAAHGFGSASSNPVAASQDTQGLVYVGTNGRGVFYGTP